MKNDKLELVWTVQIREEGLHHRRIKIFASTASICQEMLVFKDSLSYLVAGFTQWDGFWLGWNDGKELTRITTELPEGDGHG